MVFTEDDILRLRRNAEALTGIQLPEDIRCEAGEGLSAKLEAAEGPLHVTAEDRSALSRALLLAARAIGEGALPLDIREARAFRSLGPMLDVSRGAVLTVEAAKRTIDRVSALGMNLLMLYTEDVFEVPDYPYLGHLRGRYSQADLRALDAYAASMGVELVPCIQTLGHHSQFLQWAAQRNMIDQPAVLLADEEATYRFIEAEIAAMRGCLSSNRIHIGMDEAHGVGLGRYLERHGFADRFDLLNRHLGRVADICRRHNYRPMMWSDMFFRLGSKDNDYYDVNAEIPDRVVDMIPQGVDMVYWDYYHMDEAFYDHMLAQHARMGGSTVFAGGAWTWSGFLPQVERTFATMLPALRSCARSGVDTVLATLWGDDGAETNLSLGLPLLPIFSEVCWRGPDCPVDEMQAMGALISGLPWEVVEAMGGFYPGPEDVRTGKAILWCDPLYPLVPGGPEALDGAINRAHAAQSALRAHMDILESRYASAVFDIVIEKGALLRELRGRYLAGDREYLKQVMDVTLPALAGRYVALMGLHRALWHRDNKRFGWEVLCQRYGGAITRLTDVRAELNDYLEGRVDAIPELDEPALDPTRATFSQFHRDFVGPGASEV